MWLNRITTAAAITYRWYWRLRLVGDRGAIPRDGGLLLVANHSSFLDPWWLSAVFPRDIHHLITRKWYDKSPLWSGFFRANGTVPVEDDPDATLDAVAAVLERDGVVSVFPEGRISSDGRIRRFRAGIAFIAAATGAPVLPLGIRGGHRSLPRQRRIPRPTRVEIHIGPARVFPGSPRTDRPSLDEIRSFRDSLFNDVCRLSGQQERAIPHAEPLLERA